MASGFGRASGEPVAEARRKLRESLRVPATVTLPDGATENVLVDNLAIAGFRMRTDVDLAIGGEFRIALLHGTARPARTVWRDGDCIGCEFVAR